MLLYLKGGRSVMPAFSPRALPLIFFRGNHEVLIASEYTPFSWYPLLSLLSLVSSLVSSNKRQWQRPIVVVSTLSSAVGCEIRIVTSS